MPLSLLCLPYARFSFTAVFSSFITATLRWCLDRLASERVSEWSRTRGRTGQRSAGHQQRAHRLFSKCAACDCVKRRTEPCVIRWLTLHVAAQQNDRRTVENLTQIDKSKEWNGFARDKDRGPRAGNGCANGIRSRWYQQSRRLIERQPDRTTARTAHAFLTAAGAYRQ